MADVAAEITATALEAVSFAHLPLPLPTDVPDTFPTAHAAHLHSAVSSLLHHLSLSLSSSSSSSTSHSHSHSHLLPLILRSLTPLAVSTPLLRRLLAVHSAVPSLLLAAPASLPVLHPLLRDSIARTAFIAANGPATLVALLPSRPPHSASLCATLATHPSVATNKAMHSRPAVAAYRTLLLSSDEPHSLIPVLRLLTIVRPKDNSLLAATIPALRSAPTHALQFLSLALSTPQSAAAFGAAASAMGLDLVLRASHHLDSPPHLSVSVLTALCTHPPNRTRLVLIGLPSTLITLLTRLSSSSSSSSSSVPALNLLAAAFQHPVPPAARLATAPAAQAALQAATDHPASPAVRAAALAALAAVIDADPHNNPAKAAAHAAHTAILAFDHTAVVHAAANVILACPPAAAPCSLPALAAALAARAKHEGPVLHALANLQLIIDANSACLDKNTAQQPQPQQQQPQQQPHGQVYATNVRRSFGGVGLNRANAGGGRRRLGSSLGKAGLTTRHSTEATMTTAGLRMNRRVRSDFTLAVEPQTARVVVQEHTKTLTPTPQHKDDSVTQTQTQTKSAAARSGRFATIMRWRRHKRHNHENEVGVGDGVGERAPRSSIKMFHRRATDHHHHQATAAPIPSNSTASVHVPDVQAALTRPLRDAASALGPVSVSASASATAGTQCTKPWVEARLMRERERERDTRTVTRKERHKEHGMSQGRAQVIRASGRSSLPAYVPGVAEELEYYEEDEEEESESTTTPSGSSKSMTEKEGGQQHQQQHWETGKDGEIIVECGDVDDVLDAEEEKETQDDVNKRIAVRDVAIGKLVADPVALKALNKREARRLGLAERDGKKGWQGGASVPLHHSCRTSDWNRPQWSIWNDGSASASNALPAVVTGRR